MDREVVKRLSYAHSTPHRGGRAMIRLIENATGRIGLIRRGRDYARAKTEGSDMWSAITARYGLSLDLASGTLSNIPAQGPVIVVANHPYGILDGLMMGRILAAGRAGEVRIMASHIFCDAPDLRDVILPIDFSETPSAVRANLQTRAAAIDQLGRGGVIGIFPGGTVSTAPRPFGTPMDPTWRNFTAKMIARSDATVVPIYFDGANSRLFQIASHIHYNLRVGLLIREFRTRIDRPVRVCIGDPIPNAAFHRFAGDAKGCMDFLRKATYDLSPGPVDAFALGHEFEAKYKGRADGGGDFRQRVGRADNPSGDCGPDARSSLGVPW
ncbi:acyltransferase [Salipiger sp. IMCC34102]|uniref:lysophospholipid acyltransferase family protein n=1 Tax=Salipiger sp. IMCC34102 TaxID=2510647 RepID=UPI00101B5F0C|nr:lysophospholipid acyltransferase family protein [Salipiger sp. IMCC34102]RYH03010.1 acyltransferase [Salipiger sp. IMCC34102]